MNQTMRQRSKLVREAEKRLDHNSGDYIIAAVGIVGCAAILILNLMGVA